MEGEEKKREGDKRQNCHPTVPPLEMSESILTTTILCQSCFTPSPVILYTSLSLSRPLALSPPLSDSPFSLFSLSPYFSSIFLFFSLYTSLSSLPLYLSLPISLSSPSLSILSLPLPLHLPLSFSLSLCPSRSLSYIVLGVFVGKYQFQLFVPHVPVGKCFCTHYLHIVQWISCYFPSLSSNCMKSSSCTVV